MQAHYFSKALPQTLTFALLFPGLGFGGAIIAWFAGKLMGRSYLAACSEVRTEVQRLNVEGNQSMQWELEESHIFHRGVKYVDEMTLWGRKRD